MGRATDLLARLNLPRWWVVWAVIGIGLLLRFSATAFYGPSIFHFYGGDSTRYMRLDSTGIHGLFADNAMPAGYPAFLALVRHVNDWMPLTTMVQHVLGLVGGLLLYGAVRSLGAPRWAALVPLVVVALSGDVLFVEHGILTEALWMPALALAMYLLARAVAADEPRWWLVAGGAALACSAIIRNISEVLPVVLAIWAAAALPGPPRRRVQNAAAVLLAGIVVLGAYVVIAKPIAGGYSGLGENSGFSLYARVAQFADCDKFDPPQGTEVLCVETPPEQREGPFYWAWHPDSPLRTKFHINLLDGDQQKKLTRFGRAAILNQPIDYALTVGRDFARYFVPNAGTPRPSSGSSEDEMSFDYSGVEAQAASQTQLAAQYGEAYDGVSDGVSSPGSRAIFGAYQNLFRIDGRLMMLLMVLGAIGCFSGPARMRAGASLFLVSGLVLLAIPPAVSSFDIRYSVPPINLFAASAAFGLVTLVTELSRRLAPRPAEPASENP